MTSMTTFDGVRVSCPLCDWAADVPQKQYAPGVAAVFGMDAETLANMHVNQWRRQLEHDIERHMRTHGPEQWLPALMEARNGSALREARLNAVYQLLAARELVSPNVAVPASEVRYAADTGQPPPEKAKRP